MFPSGKSTHHPFTGKMLFSELCGRIHHRYYVLLTCMQSRTLSPCFIFPVLYFSAVHLPQWLLHGAPINRNSTALYNIVLIFSPTGFDFDVDTSTISLYLIIKILIFFAQVPYFPFWCIQALRIVPWSQIYTFYCYVNILLILDITLLLPIQ